MATERVVNGVKTRLLHNKDYVEVAERVRIAHQVSDDIEMIDSSPYQVCDRWLWKVVIRVSGKSYIGNAEVKLNAPKNTPDGTNPFECAETSALGRALGFAGLGTVDSIASYDEVARGKPFETHIQQISQPAVDAPQLAVATSKELFTLGTQAGLWNSGEEYLKEVSVLLGVEIARETKLTIEQRQTLAQIIEAGKDYASSKQQEQSTEPVPAVSRPQLTVVASAPQGEQAISEQQLRSIRKLSEYLNKPEPDQITALTNGEARQIIQQLTSEYKTVRQAAGK